MGKGAEILKLIHHTKFLAAISCFILTIFCIAGLAYPQPCSYLWSGEYRTSEAIANRIIAPEGYKRIETTEGTFAEWLRHIPLKKENTDVHLYNGMKKPNQDAHFAVVDIDVGDRNLQQCADAVIRLRAEYLYSLDKYEKIHFNFTSGDRADFTKWADGYRPVVNGNEVGWTKSGGADSSYRSFRKYLDMVFMYAGSYSLSKELKSVQDVNKMGIGDVFIKGGFPGHAVIVVDMAIDEKTGKKLFLLSQSYMPAQDIHILKNPNNSELNPWYELDFGKVLYTPEWTFDRDDLMKFYVEE